MTARVHVLSKYFWPALALAYLPVLFAFVLTAAAAAPAGPEAGEKRAGASCAIPPPPPSEKENAAMKIATAPGSGPSIPALDARVPEHLETAVFGLG